MGYKIAIVPHEEPVENAINAEKIKVIAGNKKGEISM